MPLISFFCLIVFSGFAQKFGGGAYAGLATTQIAGDDLGGYNLSGANIGVFTDYNITNRFKLQLELTFIQKGAKELPSDTSNFNKIRLNYFEIPVLISYRWKKLSLELGPALDILVSSATESMGAIYQSDPPFYPFNLSGIFGVNWHFTEKTHISFRTNNSITIIRESNVLPGVGPNAIQIGKVGLRNLALSFAIVYRLSSGRI